MITSTRNRVSVSLVLGLVLAAPEARARPSHVRQTWLAAKAAVLRPRDSLSTIHNAQRVLQRRVSLGEKISILAAHNTGVGRRDLRDGKLHWQPGVIAKKASMLRSFTPVERRALFQAQVVGVGRWTMLVKPGERYAPRKFNGVTYPNVYEAARAMARYWGVEYRDIDIVTDSAGYRVLP